MKLKIRNSKGVSLLEIMISIVLLCIVMVTFAMVFPGGYRLNHKSKMESQASAIAYGIINKINSVNFLDPETPPFASASTDALTIESLQKWPNGDANLYKELTADVKPPFFLPNPNDSSAKLDGVPAGFRGIVVKILDANTDTKDPYRRGTLAKILITVGWKETRKGKVVTNYITVTSYRSMNRY